MNPWIEDYALIGNLHTAALVGRDGSIDWLCVPRFDSPACFAALLGGSSYGRWLIAPQGRVKTTRRNYRRDTLILETIFETESGEVALIDFMPVKEQSGEVDLIRLVEGRNGSVSMQMELVLRFDYGESLPLVRHIPDGMRAIVGPDAVLISTPVKARGDGLRTVVDFEVRKGESLPFVLTRYDACLPPPQARNPWRLLNENERFWESWVSGCTYNGPYRKQVLRSLITLKGLTHRPTAAMVAAPTSSLPECLGGGLNWDYRYSWLRDGTFAATTLLAMGYREEAIAWRAWLMRAVGGDGRRLQIVYGLAGERRLNDFELTHLPGYEASRPVRIGNSAYEQLQLDVYGEILKAFYLAHGNGIEIDEDAWRMLCQFLSVLESAWKKPDHGFWEVRGSPQHFTESKVAAWVAFDRAVKLIEQHGFKGPLEKWKCLRDRIHTDVCEYGFNQRRKTFVQYYGSNELDAALLRLPLVGFLPASDPRIVSTIEAIQHELTKDGLVKRYHQGIGDSSEGKFLACSFWLVDCLVAMNRAEEARQLFERLLGLCNDVGLLSEEYDDSNHRMLGNFPQALTHIALISSALNLLDNSKATR